MPIRKNRVIGQGTCNQSSLTLLRNKSSFDLSTVDQLKSPNHSKNTSLISSQSFSKFQVPKTTMTEHNPFYFTGIPQKSNQSALFNSLNQQQNHLPKKQFRPKYDKIQSIQMSPNTAKVLQKIRTNYKYNANIRKITNGWGFENKGFISNDQFQEVINKHFDSSITKQNCEEMLRSVSNNVQNIELMSFIKLVFEQEPFTKPNINFLSQQQNLQKTKNSQCLSSTLVEKISNLNETGNFNIERFCANRSVMLPHICAQKEQKGFLNSYLYTKNQDFSKTQPSLYQTMHSSSSPKFTYSSVKSHGVELNPKLFEGINQQKTRSGATPAIKLNDQSVQQNKRQKIFDSKLQVLQDLNSQQKLQKMRYINKLENIRQHQEKGKQNINEIERKVDERDKANMKRFREQNLAYNYVNFVHNDWK